MNTRQQELIEHYSRGGEKLSLAIRGLTAEDLQQSPPSDQPELGKWTIQQVVLHLADSETVYSDRMKRLIAEEGTPTLLAYDENRWISALFYEEQSASDAVQIVELIRRQLGRVLPKLSESTWLRIAMHSETGRKTLVELIEGANRHLDHHLKFIHAKRTAMGKEMW